MRPPLYFGVVAIEKGAFESPSTMVTNFTLLSYTYTLNGGVSDVMVTPTHP